MEQGPEEGEQGQVTLAAVAWLLVQRGAVVVVVVVVVVAVMQGSEHVVVPCAGSCLTCEVRRAAV